MNNTTQKHLAKRKHYTETLMASRTLLSFVFVSILLSHHAHGRYIGYDSARQLPGMCSIAVSIHGYECQEFDVKTDDGYILSVQRIPVGRSGGSWPNKTPVLLQHGLFADGMTWVLNSPEQSLAMMLADNGFDVWISNFRGTQFSRRHEKLDPRNPEFWDWSWDDLAAHDIPSVINFIFKKTGQKPHYAGHSMGTLVALVSLSEGTFQNVKSAALLTPIAYVSHMKTALIVGAANFFLAEAMEKLGFAEFDPRGGEVASFLNLWCATPGVNCYDLLTALTGKNCCLNSSTVDFFLQHEPQSSSTKNIIHFAQMVRNGVLSKYDYGNPFSNMQYYNATTPPAYDLSKIPQDFPLFLTYGGQDALSDVEDVATLLDILKSHDKDKLQVQYLKKYAHVDFIMGVDANKDVYSHIIEFFRNFE